MDPFQGANWYTLEHSLTAIPRGSILLIIDRDCYWSKHKAPAYIAFAQKLKARNTQFEAYMIDYADWEFPGIEGFPTLLVKTKQNKFRKVGPSDNFTDDLANALRIAVQNK